MCGIVGLVNGHPVASDLVNALERLEYRGYDSAGIAVTGPEMCGLTVRKVIGGARQLSAALDGNASGHAGIAHTRWATHGAADVSNAHPHVYDGVAVVHNGIIENHEHLRAELMADGHRFLSQTDSEVVPHLIARARAGGLAPAEALRSACDRLEGAYALAVLFEDEPDHLLVARQGSAIVVGRSKGAAGVASDPAALAGLCAQYATLEDGDMADLSHDGVRITSRDRTVAERAWSVLAEDSAQAGTRIHATHTRNEIAEQPAALQATDDALRGLKLPAVFDAADRLLVVACGSSFYAASAAKPFIEAYAGIPCDIEIASEFRYRSPLISAGTAGVVVSQSGETADTMAALGLFHARGVPVAAVVNVPSSSIARAADFVWPTQAGREQGIAATKSFTTQLLAMLCLGLALGQSRGRVDAAQRAEIERQMQAAGAACAGTEMLESALAEVGVRIGAESEAMFLGRGWAAAMAAEGALKLKELSYVRTDAYPAGELKHGPIALIRPGSPVILCAPSDDLLAKTVSSAEEVRARGAFVIALTDAAGAPSFARAADKVIVLPGEGLAQVFAQAVAVQLIACHTAEALGRNVDRPRNLAKSVTVE